MGMGDPSEEDVYDYSLFLLDKILSESSHSLVNFPSMPRPSRDWAALNLNPLIAEKLNYNRDVEQTDLNN